MPILPLGSTEGICRGIYQLSRARSGAEEAAGATASAAGRSSARSLRAQELLEEQFGVASNVYSVTSYKVALPRRPRVRPLEPPAPGRAAAAALRRSRCWRAARARSWPRSDYVSPVALSIAPWVGPAYTRAGHRRLRPQRGPQGTAALLRGRRREHRPGRPGRAGPPGQFSKAKLAKRSETLGLDPEKPNPAVIMNIDFNFPSWARTSISGDVVNVLVHEGDRIAANDGVIELETDKAVVEIPCPHAGHVAKLHVRKGETIKVGQAILTVESGGGGACGFATSGAEREAASGETASGCHTATECEAASGGTASGGGADPGRAGGAAPGPRTGRRSGRGPRQRPRGPHHAGRRAGRRRLRSRKRRLRSRRRSPASPARTPGGASAASGSPASAARSPSRWSARPRPSRT